MTDVVKAVLLAEAEKEAKYKSIEVEKDVELEIDEGNLLAVDLNPLDFQKLRSKKEAYLSELARDNTQLLINRIWQLPVEKVEDAVTAKLPPPKTVLPREKPVPQARKLTKWEQYAKLKGIQRKKKGRKVWDEETQTWKPKWGYGRKDETKEWMIEVPDHVDPMEDQFEKRMKAKKERVAKNELQRLRNIARQTKGRVPGVGLTPTDNPAKEQVSKALHHARKSTASLGVFTDKLPKEKPGRGLGKKRKFEPNLGDMSAEKRKSLDILTKMQNKRPIIDAERAANLQVAAEQKERSQEKGKKRGNKRQKGKIGKGAKGSKVQRKGNTGGKGGKRKGKK